MNYILADDPHREALFPFTLTRPVGEIRMGILTIREKWEKALQTSLSYRTVGYLSKKFPLKTAAENIVINASYLPEDDLLERIKTLNLGEALVAGEEYIAYATEMPKTPFTFAGYNTIPYLPKGLAVKHTWDIFSKNRAALQADFEVITAGRTSQPLSGTNQAIQPKHIFIEEGATVECSVLNATTGPIYVGKGAEVMEGCTIRGGLALCHNAVLKMGAKIYGSTTVGPYCKVGGEVNNSVLFAYSNKAHGGFLGNSVLGEWCNLGADTNTSNLKNNYTKVRLWNYRSESFEKTELQFCGLMMGDHNKCGTNTMFNTGTVVGVSTNIFGSGYPDNFIPSFSWGGASGFTQYIPKKAFETAAAMMARREIDFDPQDQRILKHVFELTEKWREY